MSHPLALGAKKMKTVTSEKQTSPFESIRFDMVDRLDREAEERTIRPQSVDWAEIHRQAAAARENS